MKKLFAVILAVSMLFIGDSVNAATITTSISGTKAINQEAEFTITISVKSATGVYGLEGNLKYDKTKIKYVKSKALSGYTLTYGSRIALDTSSPIKSGKVATFTFKALKNFAPGESTTISLTGASGVVDGNDGDVSASSSSIKITVNKAKSSDNTLKSLSVDGRGISGFKAGTTSYNLGTVSETKDSIKIAASATESHAKVSGTGTKKLSYGKNTFTVKVTAENGQVKRYTITITRKDPRESNNNLKSLSVKDQDLKFSKDKLLYTINVDKDTKSVVIDAVAESSKAKVRGTGTKTLKTGANTFDIIVTAENQTKKTYSITVVKAGDGKLSNDTSLESVTLNGKEITLNKDGATLITVDHSIEKLPLTMVPTDSKAKVSLEGATLNVGTNTVKAIVMAEDGSKEEYTLHVVRRDSLEYFTAEDKLGTGSYHLLLKDSDINGFVASNVRKTNEPIYIEKIDTAGNGIQIVQIIGKDVPYDINDLLKTVSNDELKNRFSTYEAFKVQYENDATYTLYVGNKYQDGKTYLYTIDGNNQITSRNEVTVKDGFVTFENKGAFTYVISTDKAEVEGEGWVFPFDWKDIIIILETLTILIGGSLGYKKIKELKKPKKTTRKKNL